MIFFDRPLVEMAPQARRPMLAEALERTLEGKAVENLELPIFRGNGTAGHFSISLSPMRDEQGDIISVVAVMADITDAADLQAKLMHTEKMAALGQLVSGVAHEVNNPLAAIVGFTDLLLENPAVPEEAKDELRVILQETQRTRVIVQNLLSFARHMPAQREPVRVNSVLRQTLQLRAYDFSNHGVQVIERYEQELPLTIGDPHQLRQVFLNILNNAYDAMEGRGSLRISVRRQGTRAEVEIVDYGPGIPVEALPHIFEPFFTTKAEGAGTGLGLAICHGIVQSHHGSITARNVPGAGAGFLVSLPILEPKNVSS